MTIRQPLGERSLEPPLGAPRLSMREHFWLIWEIPHWQELHPEIFQPFQVDCGALDLIVEPKLTSEFSGVTSDFAKKDDANNDEKKDEANHNNKADDADDQFSMDI